MDSWAISFRENVVGSLFACLPAVGWFYRFNWMNCSSFKPWLHLLWPEHKEPVKIPIPRHEKLTKLSSPPTQRRRSDSSQVPLASPLGKGPATIAAKHPPSSAKPPPSSASTSGGNASKRKGAMSRREELLMQLQAVEDAIAKKRSKMQ